MHTKISPPLRLLTFCLFCVALEDDTDELLELIARSDSVLTLAKHPHTRPGILGGQSSSVYLHTSPSEQDHHTSSQCHTSSKHQEPKGTPRDSQEFDLGDYSVKGNFTSAPLSVQGHSATDTSHQKAIRELHPRSAVEQLLEILQGSVY